MLNLSLALAFIASVLFSPGGRLLTVVMDASDIKVLPAYQGLLLSAFANYLLPSAIIYLVLRISGLEKKLSWSKAAHTTMGVGNCLFIVFITLRIFASTVEGGGGSFAVQSIARYVVWPAQILWALGLATLIFHSVKHPQKEKSRAARNFGMGEMLLVLAAIGLPSAFLVSKLFLLKDAPLRISREAKAAFQEHCKSAGEVILQTAADVQSLYLEPDGGLRFSGISDGKYHSVSGSSLGEPLTNSGLLLFFEKKNPQFDKDPSAPRFIRFLMKERRFESLDQPTSEYGVFQKNLVTDDEQNRLQLGGNEVTIKNLRDGTVMARLTYFTSRRHAMVCGHSGSRDFGIDLFIMRSMKLTRQIPSAF